MATGRRPRDIVDVETMNPEQLTAELLESEHCDRKLQFLALQAHLKARQLQDLQRDIASNLRPTDGPYHEGENVFWWYQDTSKIKSGEWRRGKVILQKGPMVSIDIQNGSTVRMNESKVHRDHDKWHDIKVLPEDREIPEPEPATTEPAQAGEKVEGPEPVQATLTTPCGGDSRDQEVANPSLWQAVCHVVCFPLLS